VNFCLHLLSYLQAFFYLCILNSMVMNRFCFSLFALVFLICTVLAGYSQKLVKGSSPAVSLSSGIYKPAVPDSGKILFMVDMSQWAARGKFNPLTDSVDMPGTFNNFKGSPLLQKVGTSLIYQIELALDSVTMQKFRFRINRDSTTMEFPNAQPRLFRVPADTMTVKYLYNDFDTTAVPMTFKCHMLYQIKAGHFNPNPYKDYIDVASNFNNNGNYDLLFDNPVDSLKDSIYTIKMNIPRSLISDVTPLQFKFRINGNWNTAELNGKPYRTYFLHDTTGGTANVVDVWYNDQNPAILAAPVASNLYIQGEYFVGQVLTGSYIFEDVNLKPEGKSIYNWYRADSLTQVNPELRSLDTTINYVLDSTDFHKFIAFEVTPVASGTGDSLIGKPVRTWTGLIGGVGFGELSVPKPGIYPNPVTNLITFTNIDNIVRLEIYTLLGQKVLTLETPQNPHKITWDASDLNKGVYFVKFYGSNNYSSTVKFIKN
jgi:hypothetical protein